MERPPPDGQLLGPERRLVPTFTTGLLPIGILQVWYSYDQGFWWGRSAAFYELPLIQTLGFWRIVPDTIIIVLGGFPLSSSWPTTYRRLRKVRDRTPVVGQQE